MATLPAAPAGTVSYLDPQSEADHALRVTPTRELLNHAYGLTHRIHAKRDEPLELAMRPGRTSVADLRAQRDLIDAELVRRTEVKSS
jgi:hypothetical protein